MIHSFLIRAFTLLAAAFLLTACGGGGTPTMSGGASGGGTSSATATLNPGTQEHFMLNVGDRVFFGFDKYNLTSDAQSALVRQAAYLAQNAGPSITIEGHADERGTREYNLALGDRRANSVRDFLVNRGVSASRIKTISYGKERPVAPGHNESAWGQNRRGVTVLGN